MSLPDLSVKRPVFITCVFMLMLVVGFLAFKRLPLDFYPKVTFPFLSITATYEGASPKEVETQITKPIEDTLSGLAGLKSLSSVSRQGSSLVMLEFNVNSDIKDIEQQVRARLAALKNHLPLNVKDPLVKRADPDSMPVLLLGFTADLPEAEFYDVAKYTVLPALEQVDQVGSVVIGGGREREIRIEVDPEKLKERELSSTAIVRRLAGSGLNTPAGKISQGGMETSYRVVGEFHSLQDIASTMVSFGGNEVPVVVGDVAGVVDTFEEPTNYAFVNGKPAMLFVVYRQSESNIVAVADAVCKRLASLNEELKTAKGAPHLSVELDLSRYIRVSIDDVKESIFIGIALAVIVVFLCLGNLRSTFITGLALPNSLLGAFLLMALAGFSINVMTLLALSLSIGLLIDDAIVVRENIFRHMASGMPPREAALKGSKEMQLAVVATTASVLAVFGSISFLRGTVGQFFKEFGFTVCFALAISLLDSLTMAPMLSAYLGGVHQESKRRFGVTVLGQRFFTFLGDLYARLLKRILKHPWIAIGASMAIFVGGVALVRFIPACFAPPSNFPQFCVRVQLPVGSSLDRTREVSLRIDQLLRAHKEVATVLICVGNGDEGNKATFYVTLVPLKERSLSTMAFEEIIRKELKPFAFARPILSEVRDQSDAKRGFSVLVMGDDDEAVKRSAHQLYDRLKDHPSLKDVDLNDREGAPEVQFVLDQAKSHQLGLSVPSVSGELSTLMGGTVAAVFREEGHEYNIRVRLKEENRDIRSQLSRLYVPNVNGSLIRLSDFGKALEEQGSPFIFRKNRARYISLSADIAPKGPGLAKVMGDVRSLMAKDLALPAGLQYRFQGDAEQFEELGMDILLAMGLGVLFIYLVLASLYESFVTPLAIMLVLPLALCGVFYALFLTGETLNIYSMIGAILLLGVATKNSILLVDYANQLIANGVEQTEALIESGRTRLRPILMTSLALIAGMLPIAIGLNEASKQRTSMAVAVIGGLITSTLLSLVVIPAAFSYLHRFSLWLQRTFTRLVHHS